MADGLIKAITLPNGTTYDIKDPATGNSRVFYGTCSTAAATTKKDVVCADYDSLKDGDMVIVKFSITNSGAVASLQLDVNGTGGKPIKYTYNGSYTTIPAVGYLKADQIYSFIYDGTNWIVEMNYNTNTTYYREAIYSETAAATAAKVGVSSGYTLQPGYFAFWLRYTNTSASKLTLNISSAGAKDVWLNGAVTSATNYNWTLGYYIGYYDGSVYHFRTDGRMPDARVDMISSTAKAYMLATTTAPTSSSQSVTTVADSSIYSQSSVLYGAAWNDYAEYREACASPGDCVIEVGDGTLRPSSRRLEAGASIVSDTYGFAIGRTLICDCPIAVSGRVLAKTYRNRNEYSAGDAVCAAPGGTIDIMTRDEIRDYPDRIVGIVSEIPNYETWGQNPVQVNGRIWIKVK